MPVSKAYCGLGKGHKNKHLSPWALANNRARHRKRYATDPKYRQLKDSHNVCSGDPGYERKIFLGRQRRRLKRIKRDRELIADLERSLNVTA